MLKREILLTSCAIVLVLLGQEAKATEACTATPTCEELGYIYTNCRGLISLTCPFDKTKLFCGSECPFGYSSTIALSNGNGLSLRKCVKRLSPYSNFAVKYDDYHVVSITDEVGEMTWDEAKAACAAKTTGGLKWYLVYADDINGLFWPNDKAEQISATSEYLGGTRLSYVYWTSTEASSDKGVVYAINEGPIETAKTYKFPVRCIARIK